MNDISYRTLTANIALVKVDGAHVHVTWKCPKTGREVGTSSATMVADSSLSARIGASVKRSIAQEVIYGVARTIAGLLGGAAGRVLSNATYTAAGDLNTKATGGVDYTAASREAAVVAAFDHVKTSFTWDEGRQQFVAR